MGKKTKQRMAEQDIKTVSALMATGLQGSGLPTDIVNTLHAAAPLKTNYEEINNSMSFGVPNHANHELHKAHLQYVYAASTFIQTVSEEFTNGMGLTLDVNPRKLWKRQGDSMLKKCDPKVLMPGIVQDYCKSPLAELKNVVKFAIVDLLPGQVEDSPELKKRLLQYADILQKRNIERLVRINQTCGGRSGNAEIRYLITDVIGEHMLADEDYLDQEMLDDYTSDSVNRGEIVAMSGVANGSKTRDNMPKVRKKGESRTQGKKGARVVMPTSTDFSGEMLSALYADVFAKLVDEFDTAGTTVDHRKSQYDTITTNKEGDGLYLDTPYLISFFHIMDANSFGLSQQDITSNMRAAWLYKLFMIVLEGNDPANKDVLKILQWDGTDTHPSCDTVDLLIMPLQPFDSKPFEPPKHFTVTAIHQWNTTSKRQQTYKTYFQALWAVGERLAKIDALGIAFQELTKNNSVKYTNTRTGDLSVFCCDLILSVIQTKHMIMAKDWGKEERMFTFPDVLQYVSVQVLNVIDLSRHMTAFKRCIRGLIRPSLSLMSDAGYISFLNEENEDNSVNMNSDEVHGQVIEEKIKRLREELNGTWTAKSTQGVLKNHPDAAIMQAKWHSEFALLKNTYMLTYAMKAIRDIMDKSDREFQTDLVLDPEKLHDLNPELADIPTSVGKLHYSALIEQLQMRGQVRQSAREMEKAAKFHINSRRELHEYVNDIVGMGVDYDVVNKLWRLYMVFHHFLRPVLVNWWILMSYKKTPNTDDIRMRESVMMRDKQLVSLAKKTPLTHEYWLRCLTFLRAFRTYVQLEEMKGPFQKLHAYMETIFEPFCDKVVEIYDGERHGKKWPDSIFDDLSGKPPTSVDKGLENLLEVPGIATTLKGLGAKHLQFAAGELLEWAKQCEAITKYYFRGGTEVIHDVYEGDPAPVNLNDYKPHIAYASAIVPFLYRILAVFHANVKQPSDDIPELVMWHYLRPNGKQYSKVRERMQTKLDYMLKIGESNGLVNVNTTRDRYRKLLEYIESNTTAPKWGDHISKIWAELFRVIVCLESLAAGPGASIDTTVVLPSDLLNHVITFALSTEEACLSFIRAVQSEDGDQFEKPWTVSDMNCNSLGRGSWRYFEARRWILHKVIGADVTDMHGGKATLDRLSRSMVAYDANEPTVARNLGTLGKMKKSSMIYQDPHKTKLGFGASPEDHLSRMKAVSASRKDDFKGGLTKVCGFFFLTDESRMWLDLIYQNLSKLIAWYAQYQGQHLMLAATHNLPFLCGDSNIGNAVEDFVRTPSIDGLAHILVILTSALVLKVTVGDLNDLVLKIPVNDKLQDAVYKLRTKCIKILFCIIVSQLSDIMWSLERTECSLQALCRYIDNLLKLCLSDPIDNANDGELEGSELEGSESASSSGVSYSAYSAVHNGDILDLDIVRSAVYNRSSYHYDELHKSIARQVPKECTPCLTCFIKARNSVIRTESYEALELTLTSQYDRLSSMAIAALELVNEFEQTGLVMDDVMHAGHHHTTKEINIKFQLSLFLKIGNPEWILANWCLPSKEHDANILGDSPEHDSPEHALRRDRFLQSIGIIPMIYDMVSKGCTQVKVDRLQKDLMEILKVYYFACVKEKSDRLTAMKFGHGMEMEYTTPEANVKRTSTLSASERRDRLRVAEREAQMREREAQMRERKMMAQMEAKLKRITENYAYDQVRILVCDFIIALDYAIAYSNDVVRDEEDMSSQLKRVRVGFSYVRDNFKAPRAGTTPSIPKYNIGRWGIEFDILDKERYARSSETIRKHCTDIAKLNEEKDDMEARFAELEDNIPSQVRNELEQKQVVDLLKTARNLYETKKTRMETINCMERMIIKCLNLFTLIPAYTSMDIVEYDLNTNDSVIILVNNDLRGTPKEIINQYVYDRFGLFRQKIPILSNGRLHHFYFLKEGSSVRFKGNRKTTTDEHDRKRTMAKGASWTAEEKEKYTINRDYLIYAIEQLSDPKGFDRALELVPEIISDLVEVLSDFTKGWEDGKQEKFKTAAEKFSRYWTEFEKDRPARLSSLDYSKMQVR